MQVLLEFDVRHGMFVWVLAPLLNFEFGVDVVQLEFRVEFWDEFLRYPILLV